MGESWKDILLILGGVFLLWWLEKQHQIMMLQMGYGYAQAPMYPNQPPTVRTQGPSPMPVPVAAVSENGPFWGTSGRRAGNFGGGGSGVSPLRLMLSIGSDSYEFAPRSRNGGGVNYG